VGAYFFFYEEEVERRGREEGVWEVGKVGKVGEISTLLNAHGIIPYKGRHRVIFSSHAGWQWI